MPKVPAPYRRTLAEQRRRLLRLDRAGLKKLRRLYDQTITRIERNLAALPGFKKDRFTAHQYRLFLGQLRQGMALIAQRLAGGLGDISKEVQTEALRGVIKDVSRLEGAFTGADVVLPVEEAGRFQGVITQRRESLLRAHETSMARYGSSLVTEMENQLSLGLLEGIDTGQAIDRVMATAQTKWWEAERVVRTETLWAANATQADAMADAAEDLPDLMMRWVENVDDRTYRPLDNRVAEDSIAMHGQVVPVGDVFRFPRTMPNGSPVPKEIQRFLGQSWAHPPNRPNDRASIAPWRPHWGVPGWRWVGGRRQRM